MQEFTIQDIISMFLKRKWLFAISMILAGMASLLFTVFFIPKSYQSSGMLYVNSRNTTNQTYATGADLNEMYAAERLGGNFKVILKTDKFLNYVVKDTGLDLTTKQLAQMLSVSLIQETEVITITVTCGDPALAHTIASSVLLNAKEQLADMLEVGHIKIVEDASFNPSSVAPSVQKNTLLGIIVGFMLAAGWTLFREMTDTTIKGEDDIEKYFTVPLVGSIPNLVQSEEDASYDYNYNYAAHNK